MYHSVLLTKSFLNLFSAGSRKKFRLSCSDLVVIVVDVIVDKIVLNVIVVVPVFVSDIVVFAFVYVLQSSG